MPAKEAFHAHVFLLSLSEEVKQVRHWGIHKPSAETPELEEQWASIRGTRLVDFTFEEQRPGHLNWICDNMSCQVLWFLMMFHTDSEMFFYNEWRWWFKNWGWQSREKHCLTTNFTHQSQRVLLHLWNNAGRNPLVWCHWSHLQMDQKVTSSEIWCGVWKTSPDLRSCSSPLLQVSSSRLH